MPFRPCPKCEKSVHTRLQNCPFCGIKLSAQLSANELDQLFGVVNANGRDTHRQAKDRLCELGKRLGYEAVPEYEMPGLTSRRCLIDVVWFSGDQIVVAFEVRGRRRNLGIVLGHKDRDELAGLQAQEKFIVNVSKTTGKAYFHRLRTNSNIEYAPVSGEMYSHIEDTRKTYQKAYERWTPEENLVLTKQYKEGLQIHELAKIHQRTPWAVQLRLERLGLLPPQTRKGEERK